MSKQTIWQKLATRKVVRNEYPLTCIINNQIVIMGALAELHKDIEELKKHEGLTLK